MSSLLAEKKKSLGLTNLLLGARAGQMAPPPAHHHHQEKAYADFTHEQKEQEVGRWCNAKTINTVGSLFSLFYGIVFFSVGNLAPVSLTPEANLQLVSLTPVANLPPVSLIPVVHLDLQISPRIFEKIRNGPIGIFWGHGETDS